MAHGVQRGAVGPETMNTPLVISDPFMTPLSMRETCELRVDEDFSGLLFAKHEGKRIGTSVRKVELETNDPKFAEAGRLQTELRQTKGKPFFYGWHIRRYYSEAEYQAADLFHLSTSSTFEPAGEECGTKYDETAPARCVSLERNRFQTCFSHGDAFRSEETFPRPLLAKW
jgi:hypothetical protein